MVILLAWIAATCGYIAGQAKGQLGASFSATPQARMLVTSGWYSIFRHPIYLFSTLMYTAVVATQFPKWCWIPAVGLGCLQWYRARREEAVLESAFGDAYREYKDRTLCL